jgi:hypothetical protein
MFYLLTPDTIPYGCYISFRKIRSASPQGMRGNKMEKRRWPCDSAVEDHGSDSTTAIVGGLRYFL